MSGVWADEEDLTLDVPEDHWNDPDALEQLLESFEHKSETAVDHIPVRLQTFVIYFFDRQLL
jgi:hypothetical protein